MALEEAFKDIILRPLQQNTEIRALLERFNNTNNFDHHVREVILRRGQEPCTNEITAALYSYTHLFQHLDAYQRVIELNSPFFEQHIFGKLGEVLFVDVGCGPMTSCLALADYYQREDANRRLYLDYIGFDREFCMTDLALKFGRRRDLFSENFRWAYPDQKHPLWLEHLKHTIGSNGSLIFNFSYFFGQEGVRQDLPNKIRLVKKIAVGCKVDDTFIVYLNVDGQGEGGGRIQHSKPNLD